MSFIEVVGSGGAVAGNAATCRKPDPYWSNVALLLNMNGANGGTTFTDSSPTPKTISRYGNTITSTTQYKFGGASGYFDGSGDYLATNDHADFAFGAGEFCIEGWVHPTGWVTEYPEFISQRGNYSSNHAFSITFAPNGSNCVAFFSSNGGGGGVSVTITHNFAINNWYHLVFCRVGNYCFGFVNGGLAVKVPFNITIYNSTAQVKIAAFDTVTYSGSYFKGYMDDLRITKGAGRYTKDFIIPQEQLEQYITTPIVVRSKVGESSGGAVAGGAATIGIGHAIRDIVTLALDQPIALRKLITMLLDQECGLELAMQLLQRVRDMPAVTLSLNQWVRDLRRVAMDLDQHVGICPTVRMALDQHIRIPFCPTLSLHQPVVIAGQQLVLSLQQPLRLDTDGRVSLALAQPCALNTEAAILQQIGLTVTIGGRTVEPDFVSIKTDDSNGFVTASIRFPDYEQYKLCRVGEAVIITETLDALPAEVTVLQVETLTNPEEHGSADHVLTAISPTVALDDEHLSDDLGPGVADTLMTAMAAGYGITLDWQGVTGWPFAAGELVAEDETVYAVLVRLAAASGSFLQSLPDGATLRLRPEYAVNVETWPSAATVLEVNHQDHIFSIDESPDERDGYNSFLISGQSAAAGDYRLEDTAISATVKDVRCYMVPWTRLSRVILGHTGGDWVTIDYIGVEEEQIVNEEVVVTAGIGRLQFPCYGGLTWRYKEDSLGDLTYEEDGSIATAALGDALLDVSYTTRFLQWRVTDPRAESVQIYIDEVV